jgi:hypothetical protein
MAIIFGVPIYPTVCTLSKIPFVVWAVRVLFYTEYVLVLPASFQLYRKYAEC